MFLDNCDMQIAVQRTKSNFELATGRSYRALLLDAKALNSKKHINTKAANRGENRSGLLQVKLEKRAALSKSKEEKKKEKRKKPKRYRNWRGVRAAASNKHAANQKQA